MKNTLKRREFIKVLPLSTFALAQACSKDSPGPSGYEITPLPHTNVALVKTSDRRFGVRKLMELMNVPDLQSQRVVVKPNFNTSDPPPASTHNDTLHELINELQNRGAADLTLAERSFEPFDQVIQNKEIGSMAGELGFAIENLQNTNTTHFTNANLSWQSGFQFPDIIRDCDYLVSTCCLKTHFAAGFTMSLKLAVGLLSSTHMQELHSSPNLRSMVSEVNLAYRPDLIIMDGVRIFITGGPSSGTERTADVMIAGTDRIAVDAAGLAVLKEQGSTVNNGRIFEQQQIARAVELGIGVRYPNLIDFVTDDEPSRLYAQELQSILAQG